MIANAVFLLEPIAKCKDEREYSAIATGLYKAVEIMVGVWIAEQRNEENFDPTGPLLDYTISINYIATPNGTTRPGRTQILPQCFCGQAFDQVTTNSRMVT